MSEQEKPREPIYIRAVELVRMMRLAALNNVSAADVARLVAEVWRLRAKCRGQKREIRALRLERDALAQLALAYAPKEAGHG